MSFNNVIVKKPWGHEYLIYESPGTKNYENSIAIWYLYLERGKQTSLHCHPTKKTGLILLNGEVNISFLSGEQRLSSMDKIMIRHGVFHQTTCLSNTAHILEVENPKHKEDLIRLEDNYGRAGTAYEKKENYFKSDDRFLRIREEKIIEGKKLEIKKIKTIDDIGDQNIIISGSIESPYINHEACIVAGPGDVLSRISLTKLLDKFTARYLKGIVINEI